jgi:asparagine synthase (glutamine-hydrolysing)
MCGINGVFSYHYAASAVDRGEVVRTRDHMAARGPDGSGEWISADARVGLGHRRLSILDLSDRASQPMASEDGRLVVTFNGEIYNYPELRGALEIDGARFRTTSDTEVLLHLYARHGEEMVHRLRGMFAFAIWDENRRGLLLARDLYGIKPLYTANDGWRFRFASQVKALLAGGEVSRDPEPAGIVGFHLFGSVPEPFTLYREIRSLPAGHTQWVDGNGAQAPKPYASIPAILARGSHDRADAADLREEVRAGVLDSVRAHLLADVEVGLFLSAGVDSGALLGLMREASQSHVRAITLAFEEFHGSEEDEAPLAAEVARLYGAEHIVRQVGEDEFLNELPAILEAMDQPSIDGVNTWFVAKAAREAGLKVAISGVGGDELLAGYPDFVDIPRWRRRLGPLATIPGLGRLTRLAVRAIAPGVAGERPKVLGLFDHAHSWGGAYLLRRGLFLPHELGQIMDRDLVREGLRRLKPLHRLAVGLKPDPGTDVARICALESANYMRNQLLRDADWAGMAHSLEIRVPLVDSTLLDRLAPAMHTLAPGTGKAALARAPRLPLPDKIIERAKTGFGVPTATWASRTSGAGDADEPIGLTSRRWSRTVLATLLPASEAIAP